MMPDRTRRPRLYFDHNASAPLRDTAREAMLAALQATGNPSSVHGEGRKLRRMIEDARESVAALVGAPPAGVVFTSGASEANNWVTRAGWSRIYVFGLEHESVLAPVRASGAEVVELPVAPDGTADLGVFAHHVLSSDPHPVRTLLTLQMANGETGAIQDVAAAAAFARQHGIAVHTDAVQAVGRLPIDFAGFGVDFLTLSSHKIGGPAGTGALVMRDALTLPAFIAGGGQERRRRAGTENTAGIAGFGAAASLARAEIAAMDDVATLRDRLAGGIIDIVPDAVVIAGKSERLANTLSIAIPGEAAETSVIKLDLAGIAASAGSACSSGRVGTSHVLEAMGLDPTVARSVVRLSLGPTMTLAEIEDALERMSELWAATERRVA
jgi:cysteine desulfurase